MRWQSVVNCTAGSGSIAEGYLGRGRLNTIYSKVWNHALGAVVEPEVFPPFAALVASAFVRCV